MREMSMGTARVLASATIAVCGILLVGCTSLPWTTEPLGEAEAQTQAPTPAATPAPEPSEGRPVQPADYSPEAFVQRCIDRADSALHFWDEGRVDEYGGGLHIRARDVSVYVGSDNGVDGYFAEFPNRAVPGESFYCWSAPADPYSTGTYPHHNQDIWLRIRGPVFYEVDVDLKGDAYYRVSQEPIWYEQTS